MQVIYRTRQFWHALRAAPTTEDLALARSVLTPPLQALFLQMQEGEQAHSIQVLRKIMQTGGAPVDLKVAALLHDVGKTCYPLDLWERVVIVVARAVFPGQVKHWGQGPAKGWRRPFAVSEQHAAWGEEMAAKAGASALACALIRRHQEYQLPKRSRSSLITEDQLLVQLQLFDNES